MQAELAGNDLQHLGVPSQAAVAAFGLDVLHVRIYASAHVERLAFIRNCRSLDMALDEVRELLRFRDAPGKDCANVNTLLDEHIGHVSQRIRELRALERELRVLRARCEKPGHGKACGILGGLENSSGRTSKAPAQRHVRGTH